MAVTHRFFLLQNGQLHQQASSPPNSKPLLAAASTLLPPQISDLHRSLRNWHDANLSVGAMLPSRFWLGSNQQLLIRFPAANRPQPANPASNRKELAGWLLLLDKWMETFVVIARARTVWKAAELAAALPFLSPAYLPSELRETVPDNWLRLSAALSIAVADGELSGEPTNRHWTR